MATQNFDVIRLVNIKVGIRTNPNKNDTYPCSEIVQLATAGRNSQRESSGWSRIFSGSDDGPDPWLFGVAFCRFRPSRRRTNLLAVAAPTYRWGKTRWLGVSGKCLAFVARLFNKHFNFTRRTVCLLLVWWLGSGWGKWYMQIINARLAATWFSLHWQVGP